MSKYDTLNTKPYLTRLNHREPHDPADPFYIKRNRVLLKSCLDDRQRIDKMLKRGSPEVKQRFDLFPIC